MCKLATDVPEFKNFDFYKERMDYFYVTILDEKPKFKELFNVVKLVCILSHGNATVESGFSINWDAFVENLLENMFLLKGKSVMEFITQEVFWKLTLQSLW